MAKEEEIAQAKQVVKTLLEELKTEKFKESLYIFYKYICFINSIDGIIEDDEITLEIDDDKWWNEEELIKYLFGEHSFEIMPISEFGKLLQDLHTAAYEHFETICENFMEWYDKQDG